MNLFPFDIYFLLHGYILVESVRMTAAAQPRRNTRGFQGVSSTRRTQTDSLRHLAGEFFTLSEPS
ncbi:MAG: hypothetical protein ACREAC_18210, partial [Blastocatellia bacterium]